MSNRKFANAKTRRTSADRHGISARIRALRIARFGQRGQTAFCKAVVISPSTYHYYENNREPPAGVLVRMADVGRTSLEWLLTGQGAMDAPEARLSEPASGIVARASRLLGSSSSAGPALAAFIELLESIEGVQQQRIAAAGPMVHIDPFVVGGGHAAEARRVLRMIPVLGRTAAAVPRFWASAREGRGLTNQLAEAIRALGGRQRAVCTSQVLGSRGRRGSVALVQLSQPVELAGLSVSEVVESERLVERWPDAFGLRIDGESMQPVFEPNDLVIVSASVPAEDGQPAIVQLAGQIGVTCKVYRRVENEVRLVPLNVEYPATVHATGELSWALKVLARIRAAASRDGS